MANTGDLQRKVLHLFERVNEPITDPKADGRVAYILPVADPARGPTDEINFRFGETQPELRIQVRPHTLPDLTTIKLLPRGRPFSYFVPLHREIAHELTKFLMASATADELIESAALLRDEINEQLFVFCLMTTTLRRKDFRGVRLPPIFEVLPDRFFESRLLKDVQKQVKKQPQTSTALIYVDRFFSATDKDPENKIAYFREDLGINSHHWHWHLIYPFDGVPRDRRGELFYYMHQQIIARYDAERLANALPRVQPFHNWDEAIPEAYFPKLTMDNSGVSWGTRPAGLRLSDINIPDESIDVAFQINDLERWRTRIYHAIHQGVLENRTGEKIRIDGENDNGINLLGDIIEAADTLSVNYNLYGNMHNLGHIALAFIHDPRRAHRENAGVMYESMTAMRDPIFYRWHKFIDDLFQQHKATVTSYTNTPTEEQKKGKFALTYDQVDVDSVQVITQDGNKKESNVFVTGWQLSDLTLNRGLDFSARVPIMARARHIQHRPFSYIINLNNKSSAPQDVVLRVFIAPTFDELGQEIPLRDQRLLMIELDKFNVQIAPGKTKLERKSSDSSVTIPFERTFRELEPSVPGGIPSSTPSSVQFNFCGCGWPDHFLIPRGTKEGMAFKLFVMATDWSKDKVERISVASGGGLGECRNAASYCGILDQKYPDKRPMGYPFDRPPPTRVRNLNQFLTPNMKVQDVRIVFRDEVISTRQPQI